MKFKQIQVRIEPELREKLQAEADRDQRPLASLIRIILSQHLAAKPGERHEAAA